MKLSALLDRAVAGDATVTGFAIDHRRVAPGNVFGAFQGATFDGESVIADAVASGAVAVVATAQASVAGAEHVVADDPRAAFARLAARFFAPYPGTVVAVTGTNGKTSCVELTRQLWRLAGRSAASIGTLGITTNDDRQSTGLTTPDVVTFLGTMHGLSIEGVGAVAYEASSHGLDQSRCVGVPVRAGAFTNLSRDHLDYHGTMDAYLAAKLRLFSDVIVDGGTAVVWADDPASADVVAAARARGLTVLTVGATGTDLRLLAREPGPLGQTLTVEAGGATHRVVLPLIGAYQAANALVAAGLVIATGGDLGTTLAALARVQPVRGRLERAGLTRSGATIYVDYAHTPDALEAALDALRPHTAGRLICVFGAGGDRDQGKRPAMGRVAAERADIVIVTDDNPRGEEPGAIRAAILTGTAATAAEVHEIGDRRAAIGEAIALAGPDDILCIAGKGHEQGQIIGSGDTARILPFDDVTVARECAA